MAVAPAGGDLAAAARAAVLEVAEDDAGRRDALTGAVMGGSGTISFTAGQGGPTGSPVGGADAKAAEPDARALRRRRSSGTGKARRRSSTGGRQRRNSYIKRSEEPQPTRKEQVWALVDDPMSSTWAKLIAVLIMSLIGVSCVTFCLETLPQFHRKDVEVWFAIEVVCIFFFTLEYIARLLSCPNKCQFMKGVLNTVDLVAIVPFYVELILDETSGGSSAVFRVVRLVRVFRVFKISRYVSWVKIFANAMYASAQPLGMLLFVMAIGCVVFSSAIYFAERGTWDDVKNGYYRQLADGTVELSPYQSIPAAFWWCIITMTTVGYGDDVPVTFLGKLIAGVASLSGILVLAIPITVISTNFNYEFGRMKKRREAMRQKMLMFKRQFGTHTANQGLGVIKDEIDAMVRRNTAELMEDFSNVTTASRDELAQELYDLVQIAYKQRQMSGTEAGQAHPNPTAAPSGTAEGAAEGTLTSPESMFSIAEVRRVDENLQPLPREPSSGAGTVPTVAEGAEAVSDAPAAGGVSFFGTGEAAAKAASDPAVGQGGS